MEVPFSVAPGLRTMADGMHQRRITLSGRMRDPSRGWGDLLPAWSLQVTPVPGTHHSMMDPPNAAVLGEALSQGLRLGSAWSGTPA